MAAIEKVCEFSGDYPGGLMYGYKRNHIQICPEYRKKFRGAKAHIEITEIQKQFVFKGGGWTSWDPTDEWFDRCKGKVTKEYTFVLVVENPELAGEVDGRYLNWTFDMNDTIKRLKRMLRARDIKVYNRVGKSNSYDIGD